MAQAFRGTLVHCLRDPGERAEPTATEVFTDGILLLDEGRVAAVGPAAELLPSLGDSVEIVDVRGKLILPGLIDCHVHFPQLDIIGSYGTQLLEWLQRYAFPAEARCTDDDYTQALAAEFLDQLLANGTTTALVFASVHAHSADALLSAAAERGMRLIAGKVWMDRNCPPELRDSAESAADDSRMLIEKWHGHGRLGYAITPRFAITSSDLQLAAAGRLAAEFPDVWIHTHLAESPAEIEEVRGLFPDTASYLDVYRRNGLVRERSVFAHCLHLESDDRQTLAQHRAAAAFCPTSNLFLGSGLFDLRAMRDAGVRCGLATDVGGGTSLSLLQTASEAYKVLQLQGQTLPAERALWLATLGAAEALHLDGHIGNFEPGKEADFVILDPAATRRVRRRLAGSDDVAETLFALLALGDERHVAATYVAGEAASVNKS